MEITESIRRMIVQKVSSEDIERESRNAGMHTMIEDGIIKAALGITSIEEILRVTKE
jgi:type II secretory ATPase GspE/PulE/Tfp pilus assembly ATPase PilB-like protein